MHISVDKHSKLTALQRLFVLFKVSSVGGGLKSWLTDGSVSWKRCVSAHTTSVAHLPLLPEGSLLCCSLRDPSHFFLLFCWKKELPGDLILLICTHTCLFTAVDRLCSVPGELFVFLKFADSLVIHVQQLEFLTSVDTWRFSKCGINRLNLLQQYLI